MSLVVRMPLAMYSYWAIENFVGMGYFLRVIAVAEAVSRLLVAEHTDLESG